MSIGARSINSLTTSVYELSRHPFPSCNVMFLAVLSDHADHDHKHEQTSPMDCSRGGQGSEESFGQWSIWYSKYLVEGHITTEPFDFF
jgi:hypothetical protein